MDVLIADDLVRVEGVSVHVDPEVLRGDDRETDEYRVIIRNNCEDDVSDWKIELDSEAPLLKTLPQCNERSLERNVIGAPLITWLCTDWEYRSHKRIRCGYSVRFRVVLPKGAPVPSNPRVFVRLDPGPRLEREARARESSEAAARVAAAREERRSNAEKTATRLGMRFQRPADEVQSSAAVGLYEDACDGRPPSSVSCLLRRLQWYEKVLTGVLATEDLERLCRKIRLRITGAC